MRFTTIILYTAVLGFILFSCDPCRNLDCLSSNYYGSFRIIKATDGTDLVFGTSRIYDKNKIKFYSLKGTDTTYLQYQPIRFPNTGYDSVLHVDFYPGIENAFMRLSNGDVDTLRISYKTYNTRCCGTITEIANFRLNNLVDLPVGKGVQEIKK